MARDRSRASHWRVAVMLTAIVLVGVWVWQRDGSTPEVHVVAAAPQADESALAAMEPPEHAASPTVAAPPSQPRDAAPSLPDLGAIARSAAEAAAEAAKDPPTTEPPADASDGQTFTYWDGDAQRTVTLISGDPSTGGGEGEQDGVDGSASGLGRRPGVGGLGGSSGPSGDADNGDLLFRSESGTEMLLQNSIVLVLDPDWSDADVRRFLARNRIHPRSASPLGWLPNGFTVTTDRGIAALQLANALAAQEGVVLSSPNWASELEVK